MRLLIEWGKLTWPEAEAAVQRMPVALLPLGAIEQHGPHMTLDTDNMAAAAFARRLAARTGAILLPVLPYGQVWSLSRFPGTLSISNETLKAVTKDIAHSLHDRGFKALVTVSGHLGNGAALRDAARELYDSLPLRIVNLFYPGLAEIAAEVLERPRWHTTITHADELETSLLLELAPECVRMDLAVSEYPERPPDFEYRPLYWDEICKSGVFGDATAATAEKGAALVSYVLDRAAAIVERVIAEVGR